MDDETVRPVDGLRQARQDAEFAARVNNREMALLSAHTAQAWALIDIAESLRDLVGASSIFQDTVRNERIRVEVEGLVHTAGS